MSFHLIGATTLLGLILSRLLYYSVSRDLPIKTNLIGNHPSVPDAAESPEPTKEDPSPKEVPKPPQGTADPARKRQVAPTPARKKCSDIPGTVDAVSPLSERLSPEKVPFRHQLPEEFPSQYVAAAKQFLDEPRYPSCGVIVLVSNGDMYMRNFFEAETIQEVHEWLRSTENTYFYDKGVHLWAPESAAELVLDDSMLLEFCGYKDFVIFGI
jgi:hypothetical protein